MQALLSELSRLYLTSPGAPLITGDGRTRAIVLAFEGDDHWTRLCKVANALQAELGLPAPAVSVSGARGFQLWLSLAAPIPLASAQHFAALLGTALAPDSDMVRLPPYPHPDTGLWAAFINPGLGASFADESGLEMAPPETGQVALLHGLDSISEAAFAHALRQLAPPKATAAAPAGLLLKDATLDDIVAHLHALNIEPTFRYLIGKPPTR